MKVVPKVFLITLLASVVGLVGCDENLLQGDSKANEPSLIIEKSVIDNSITLLLPQVVVELKQGKPKYGWLNQFNSPKKQLQIAWNGVPQTINFKDIKRLRFVIGKAPFSSPNMMVKNEKELSEVTEETWVGVPTSDFKLRTDRTDKGKLKLSNSILANSNQFMFGSSYVIEAIEFDESLQKMKLKVFLHV